MNTLPQRPLLPRDVVAPPDGKNDPYREVDDTKYVGAGNRDPQRPTLLVLPELIRASR